MKNPYSVIELAKANGRTVVYWTTHFFNFTHVCAFFLGAALCLVLSTQAFIDAAEYVDTHYVCTERKN